MARPAASHDFHLAVAPHGHEETVEAPRGSEQKFASERDVVEKFAKLTRRVMTDTQAERIGAMRTPVDKRSRLVAPAIAANVMSGSG